MNQAKQGGDRQKKQECLDSLQSAFEKHMTEYEVSVCDLVSVPYV